jgi:2-amino-4-hydroxy-6-hydroxymethyldihydropteridine diphosphokinase
LGLGSNLGDSRKIIIDAVKELELILLDLRRASLYETSPLHVADQGRFINTVVAGFYGTGAESQAWDPLESARELLSRIHIIEKRFGRDRTHERRWGERFLDIDILLLGNYTLNEPDIIVPHPLLKERRFALQPLLEILPDAVEPDTGLSYTLYCQSLPDQGVNRLA